MRRKGGGLEQSANGLIALYSVAVPPSRGSTLLSIVARHMIKSRRVLSWSVFVQTPQIHASTRFGLL